jgi:hypothetical protein
MQWENASIWEPGECTFVAPPPLDGPDEEAAWAAVEPSCAT